MDGYSKKTYTRSWSPCLEANRPAFCQRFTPQLETGFSPLIDTTIYFPPLQQKGLVCRIPQHADGIIRRDFDLDQLTMSGLRLSMNGCHIALGGSNILLWVFSMELSQNFVSETLSDVPAAILLRSRWELYAFAIVGKM